MLSIKINRLYWNFRGIAPNVFAHTLRIPVKPINRHRGSALLTALFIMTLVAIVATAMSLRLQQDIYRTQLMLTHDKLYLASQAVQFWAQQTLTNKKILLTQANQQGVVLDYPTKLSNLYPGCTIRGELYDLQARYNINNISDKNKIMSFVNLMEHAYPGAQDNEKVPLIRATIDWISPYDLNKGKDHYASYYSAQKPPYQASHQLMASPSELRLIKEVSAPANQAIQPLITALPETTAININTASKQVLMSLGDGLNDKQAKELIDARGEKGISNLSEINPLLQKLNIPSVQVTVSSQYFLSKAYVSSKDMDLIFYVILKRAINKEGQVHVSVLRESIETI